MTGAASVTALVEAFDRDPAAGKQLRALLNTSPEAFRAGALAALKSSPGGRGYRFLVTQLVVNNLVLDCLAAPSLTTAEAAELARAAARVDPRLDILLAKRIGEEAASPSGRYSDADMARLLETLEQIGGGLRAAPALGPLLNHGNPRLRSKAALLVGRASQNAALAARQLASDDARVRANAVEALWGAESAHCRDIFHSAVLDPNCRVAGNAALGLYRLGDTAGVRALLNMAGHASPDFRSTAAWCMGACEDPRFLAPLERLAAGGGGKVRHNALRSIARVRHNAVRMADAGRLRIEITDVTVAGGEARLRVAVAADGQPDLQGLPPTCFAVREGGELVGDYAAEELPLPEIIAAGFVLPQNLAADVIGDCLCMRRPGDKWAVAKYAERAEEVRESVAQEVPPRFVTDMTMLHAAMAAPGRATKGMLEAAAELLNVAVLARGGRHIVLLAGAGAADERRAGALAMAARAAKAPVHIVAMPGCGNTALASLAAAAGGRYFQPGPREGVADSMQRLCLGMLSRYEIRWAPRGGAREVGVEVWCGRGFGEGAWRHC